MKRYNRKFKESFGTTLLMKSKLSNEEMVEVLKSAGHRQAGTHKNDR
jgi:hypothetical protein